MDHGVPDPRARWSRRGRGLPQHAVQEHRVVRRLARTVVPPRSGRPAVVVRPGRDASKWRRWCSRSSASRSPSCCTAGVWRARSEEPLDAKLGPIAPVLGHAYYYDDTVSKLVDGPGRGFASFLDRVVDQKIIDGTVDGIGGLVKRAAPRPPPRARRPRAPLRARHRVRRGRTAPLSRRAGRLAVDHFPILSVIIAVPFAGALVTLFMPARPSGDRQGDRLRDHHDHVRLRGVAALELQHEDRRIPVRAEPAVDTRARCSLHRRGRRHQHLHDRGDRVAVPARVARVGEVHPGTGSRPTSRGSCSSRARSWGSSSPST